MPEETITFELIRSIQREEQQNPKLTKLPENFYQSVASYLKQKRKLIEAKEDRKLALEIKNIERLVEDIFNRRERKILNQALITARTNIPPENLTDEEKEFFESLVDLIKQRRKVNLNSIFASSKEELVSLVMFKEDVPEFVGSVPGYTPVIIKDDKGFIDILPISDLAKFNKSCYEVIRLNGLSTITPYQLGCSWAKIKSICRYPFKGKIRRINTVGGLVDVSLNHSIITKDGRVVDAKKLKKKKQLLIPALDLQNNSLSMGNRDLAWLYGYFAGNGSVSFANCEISFSDANKMRILKAKKMFENIFKKQMRLFKDKNIFRISVSSRSICNFLRRFYTNDGLKKVPKEILNAQKEIKLAFLNGCFRADGYKLYKFQTFITSSHCLAAGILYLIATTTKQSWSVYNNKSEIRIRLNKTSKNSKNIGEIKNLKHIYYEGYLYDIETENHKFLGGIGPIALHNTDLKIYGPFKKGDIAKLPKENVKVLIERGVVEEFKVSK